MNSETSNVLYLVVTGAPLTRRLADGVIEARDRGWQPAIITTGAARPWLDVDALAKLDVTVLTEQRDPSENKRLSPAGSVLLAPGTFNTINKLATGIADTYATGVLCEAISLRVRTVIVPFVSTRLAGHPAWLASLAVLRYSGATLIDPRDGSVNTHEPLTSGSGDAVADSFEWSWALDQLHEPSSTNGG